MADHQLNNLVILKCTIHVFKGKQLKFTIFTTEQVRFYTKFG
jgi:hypothetical protein